MIVFKILVLLFLALITCSLIGKELGSLATLAIILLMFIDTLFEDWDRK